MSVSAQAPVEAVRRAPPDPTPEQAAAIESRGEDVFLEAGAGTGKTGVLVQRYCEAVSEDGVGPDQILAFTFTDRAAAQLRSRIRDELDRRAGTAAGGEDRRRLAGIVAEFGGTWITTIHGFCHRLLAAHPVAAGIDPRFRVLDAPEADRARRAAFEVTVEDFLAGRDPAREATVAAYRVDGLRSLVTGAYEELRSRGQEQPELPDPPAPDLGSALAEVEALGREVLAEGKATAGQLAKVEAALELAGRRDREPARLDKLSPLCFTTKVEGTLAEFCAAMERARCRAAESELGLVTFSHISELLRVFGRRYGEEKAARAGLDFEDLQLLATRLLHTSEAVGEAYRGRFDHLMVDEFQDTNALQLSLVEALSGPATRRFVVGDEFQSIYGFRHADLDAFRGERERYESASGAAVRRLSGNFRSRPELIATANALGRALLADFRELTVAAEPERPAPPGGGPAVELQMTEEGGWEDEPIDLDLAVDDRTRPRYIAEARFLAARLRELCEDGVRRGDVVVLLRAFTRVDAYEEALDRAGLSPYVVGGRGYWSQQQVEDVRALLAVIANPLDDEALLGALAAPGCGVLPDTMWLLRRARGARRPLWQAILRATGVDLELEEPGWLEHIEGSQLDRLQRFRSVIDGLREIAPMLALEELIERAVTVSGYDLAALMRPLGRQRYANVRKLMQLAREFEAHEGRDLRGFLEFTAARAGQDDEPAAATEAEDHDGVRIMTIHNAKGLEFPVVAIPDLGRGLLEGGWPPDLRVGRDADAGRVGMRLARLGARSVQIFDQRALKEADEVREAAEALRLFYVGATRARDRLILSGVLPDRRNGSVRPGTSVIERLPALLGLDEISDGAVVRLPSPSPRPGLSARFAAAEVVVRVNRASPERAAELVRASRAGAPSLPPQWTSPPLLRPAAPAATLGALSYSALAEHRRCGYRFHVERVLGLGRREPAAVNGAAVSPRAERFGYGSAVHALLEWSSRNRWIAPTDGLVRRHLAAEGLAVDESMLARARAQIGGWLDSDLCRELRGHSRLRAELPFLISLSGSVLRGSLDLLGEPASGPPIVLDYKTDRTEGLDPVELAGRYEIQKQLYAVAAARATGAERVRVAWVFLEQPDSPVTAELGTDELLAAQASLEAAVGAIAAGDFEVTPAPTWELCRDCPARARLCPSPAAPPAAGPISPGARSGGGA